jgi:hypothetical protein
MPEPADYTDQGALPGLEPPTEHHAPSQLEAAARRSLEALHAAGLLTEAHAMPMALVVELARVVGRAVTNGQGAAAAMAAAQLREAWTMLPDLEGAGAGGGDEWEQLARELRKASEDERRRIASGERFAGVPVSEQ